MLNVVFSVLKRCNQDWTHASMSDSLDLFIASYRQENTLSILAANAQAMSATSGTKGQMQLAPEAQRLLDRATRFWRLVDFVVEKLNVCTFPDLETTKFLLNSRKDRFDAEKIKAIFGKTQLGSEMLLPTLISAVHQIDDLEYRACLLSALKDAALSSKEQLENVCCTYSALLSTSLIEDILPNAVEYAINLSSNSSEMMDCLHILRACLEAKQYDKFEKLLSSIKGTNGNMELFSQVIASIAEEMARLAHR
eukprot:TRINITY_DN10987_c0_g1_i1.p1 TRINITY_DN10987_c0_g1~~TRINITY_DN10987_c0_g1_i1.p1  ORF type:complete len:252 (-),score=40.45 TRINITY_DN10987_c0_g1_i1:183-938(-)